MQTSLLHPTLVFQSETMEVSKRIQEAMVEMRTDMAIGSRMEMVIKSRMEVVIKMRMEVAIDITMITWLQTILGTINQIAMISMGHLSPLGPEIRIPFLNSISLSLNSLHTSTFCNMICSLFGAYKMQHWMNLAGYQTKLSNTSITPLKQHPKSRIQWLSSPSLCSWLSNTPPKKHTRKYAMLFKNVFQDLLSHYSIKSRKH